MTYDYTEWLKNGCPKILCKCGCQEEIVIKKRYKYYDIPEYLHGHGKLINITSESYKKWLDDGCPKVICNCGCNKEIIVKRHLHKCNGIPERLCGHNKSMLGKITSKETKIKQSNARLNKYYGENNPFYGKSHSEKTKQKISNKKLGCIPWNKGLTKEIDDRIIYGKNSSRFGKIVSHLTGKGSYYDSPLQGTIWLRSSYEIAYAKYLDENNILWLYEIQTFNLGNTTYTPDFYLPTSNLFIEIKGYMTDKAQNKINKFLDNYNDEGLKILYKEDLIKLGIEIKL